MSSPRKNDFEGGEERREAHVRLIFPNGSQ